MIFVTLGTQKFQFDRILKELDKLIEENKIKKDDLVVQSVMQEYKPKNYYVHMLMKEDEFIENIKKAEIIITHSGTGSIISCIKNNKRFIIVPRLKEYGEHIDDHQIELAEVFREKANGIVVLDIKDLYDAILKAPTHRYEKWELENSKLIKDIETKINKYLL